MKVEFNDKTLWHVQSITDWHDEPYDIFVFSKQEPNRQELTKLFRADLGTDADELEHDEVKDLVYNANVYTVYAEEL